eukprot:7819611-Alexandrium_andersonii.AAC.1
MAPHAGPPPACDRRGCCLVRHCAGCDWCRARCRGGTGPPRDAAGDPGRCRSTTSRGMGRDLAASGARECQGGP